MYKVYIIMEHKDNGIHEIVQIHEDREYAEFRAKCLRDKYGQFYNVMSYELIKASD